MIFKILREIKSGLAVVFITATSFVFGQNYIITPNDTIKMNGGMEDLATLSIQQVNTTTKSINLKWEKLSEKVPSNWEAWVCDNKMCYATLEDSGSMNPVFQGEYGLVLLHITPHVNFGTAVIRYSVWDIENEAVKDTLTYILAVNETSGINLTNTNGIRISPNPAQNIIHILSNLQGGFQFYIHDFLGNNIYSGVSYKNAISLSTENFQNGIYSISITNKNKLISSKKLVIQH